MVLKVMLSLEVCCQSFAGSNYWLPQDVLWQRDQKVHYMFWGKSLFYPYYVFILISSRKHFSFREERQYVHCFSLYLGHYHFSWIEYIILIFFNVSYFQLYSFTFHRLFCVTETETNMYLYEIAGFNMSFSTHPFVLGSLIFTVRSCTTLKTYYIWFSSLLNFFF